MGGCTCASVLYGSGLTRAAHIAQHMCVIHHYHIYFARQSHMKRGYSELYLQKKTYSILIIHVVTCIAAVILMNEKAWTNQLESWKYCLNHFLTIKNKTYFAIYSICLKQ